MDNESGRERQTSIFTLVVRRCLHSQTLSIQPRFHIYLYLGKVPRRFQSWERDAETLSCNKQSALNPDVDGFWSPSFRGDIHLVSVDKAYARWLVKFIEHRTAATALVLMSFAVLLCMDKSVDSSNALATEVRLLLLGLHRSYCTYAPALWVIRKAPVHKNDEG